MFRKGATRSINWVHRVYKVAKKVYVELNHLMSKVRPTCLLARSLARSLSSCCCQQFWGPGEL